MSTTPGITLTCTHPGCTKRSVARGLCAAHYQAAWKAGELGQHQKQPPRARVRTICPPEHKHNGSLVCYDLHQCRCEPYAQHRAETDTRRAKLKAYGRFDTGLVDADPVREHLLMLGEFGLGYKRVARIAGAGVTPVRNVIWARQDPGPRNGEIPKRIKRENAEKILAVKPDISVLAGGASIPSRGTHRRLQALFRLVRRARGRLDLHTTRRARPELCTRCGEIGVTVDWIDGPDGQARLSKVCVVCRITYTPAAASDGASARRADR